MKARSLKRPLRGLLGNGLMISALVPALASAQLKPEAPTGSRIGIKPNPVEKRDAGIIKKGFGRCAYAAAPKAAVAFLQNSDLIGIDLKSANIKSVSKTFGMETCLGDQVGAAQSALGFKFSINTLHAILAEEAYLSSQRSTPVLAPNATEGLERHYAATGDDLIKARTLGGFADCIVFKDAAGADAVLRTMPGSPAELLAVRALAPTLGACLDDGARVSLTATSIRGYVADGLWNRFSRPTQAIAATVTKR